MAHTVGEEKACVPPKTVPCWYRKRIWGERLQAEEDAKTTSLAAGQHFSLLKVWKIVLPTSPCSKGVRCLNIGPLWEKSSWRLFTVMCLAPAVLLATQNIAAARIYMAIAAVESTRIQRRITHTPRGSALSQPTHPLSHPTSPSRKLGRHGEWATFVPLLLCSVYTLSPRPSPFSKPSDNAWNLFSPLSNHLGCSWCVIRSRAVTFLFGPNKEPYGFHGLPTKIGGNSAVRFCRCSDTL